MSTIIGKTMAKARKRKGWSQPKLAEEANVSLDWVRQVEQGRIEWPGLGHLKQVAAVLDVSIDGLLKGELPTDIADGFAHVRSPEHALATSASFKMLGEMTEEQARLAEKQLEEIMAMDDDEFQNPTAPE